MSCESTPPLLPSPPPPPLSPNVTQTQPPKDRDLPTNHPESPDSNCQLTITPSHQHSPLIATPNQQHLNPNHPHASHPNYLPNLHPKSTNPNPPRSFANLLKPNSYMNKELGIIIDDTKFKTIDYLNELAKITNPSNLTMVSRVSGKMRIFLSTREEVIRISTHHPSITIKNCQLNIRPLVSPCKKIIISGAKPWVPNPYILDILRNHNVNAKSVEYSKLGLNDPKFAHILNETRFIYSQDSTFPEYIQFTYQGEPNKIHLFVEKMTCYFCKSDHPSHKCPQNNEEPRVTTDCYPPLNPSGTSPSNTSSDSIDHSHSSPNIPLLAIPSVSNLIKSKAISTFPDALSTSPPQSSFPPPLATIDKMPNNNLSSPPSIHPSPIPSVCLPSSSSHPEVLAPSPETPPPVIAPVPTPRRSGRQKNKKKNNNKNSPNHSTPPNSPTLTIHIEDN
ncbi:hypothetical protein M8J75_002188 [Diaphorina citri]|nr:hypothetical protein M8J75_002188 [Diaphorina citri]